MVSMVYLIQIDDKNKICDEEEVKDILGTTTAKEAVALYRLTRIGNIEKLCVIRDFKQGANDGGYVTDLFDNLLFSFNGGIMDTYSRILAETKEVLEDKINETFAELQRRHGIKSGDIDFSDNFRLDEITEDLSRLIAKVITCETHGLED